MKRRLTKITILVLAIIATALLCTLAIIGATEDKTYTVTYYSNGNVSEVFNIPAGQTHNLLSKPFSSTQDGKQLYGWYDDLGTFHLNNSKQITVNKNYTFYEACGTSVVSKEEFVKAIKQAGHFVRLGANITVDEMITLPSNGLVVIDLNGYNLTLNSKEIAFKGVNASIHIVNTSTSGGKIVHTGEASNADLMDATLFSLSPNPRKNAEIRFFKNTGVETNVGLIDIVSDLTYSKNTYSFVVDGSVKANFLVRTYGIKDAVFKVGEAASINVTGQYVFEDRGNCDGINLTFQMSAGKLDMLESAFITNELSKYNVFLTGGSYNRDLNNLYPNYRFAKGTDGRYTIQSCAHNDIAIGMTANCTESGEITYKCTLCGLTHTVQSGALGHSVYKELAKEAVATKDKTEPGYYRTICQRCGYEENEYFYPAPRDTYVTLKYRKDDKVQEIRIKSTLIFGEDIGDRLQTFSTTYVEFQYNVKQSEIISIEIPLGVKSIAGGKDEDNRPIGLFYENTHLEEIILPMSIENIEGYAFSNMKKLKTITGIEYITGKISTCAFKQEAANSMFIERMYVNASTIESEAFYNFTMTSLTLGENVSSIANSAFGIDGEVTSRLKEIFIEGNTQAECDGITFASYNVITKRFNSIGSGHQFDGAKIVFIDHEWDTVTTKPTCQSTGFDFNKCIHCGEEEINNFTDIIDHEYVTIDPPVPSTCSTQGYEGTKCTMCDHVRVSKYYPYDPATHDYTYAKFIKFIDVAQEEGYICENDYYEIGKCVCGALDEVPTNWKYMTKVGQHDWNKNNPLEVVFPTCGEEGFVLYNCTRCGYETREITKATGKHTFVTDNKNTIPATCSTKGKMVWACSECGETKEREADLNPDNHEWEKDQKGNLVWTVKVAATPEKAGTAQNKCLGCGKAQTKGIPVTSEETKGISTLVLVLLIAGGSILILGAVGLTLYFTVFKKNTSSGYKYNFNTLNKKKQQKS